MDNCLLCHEKVAELKRHPGVFYCNRCCIYQVPSGYYFNLDLKIKAKGRKSTVRQMPSLNSAWLGLLQIEKRKNP